MSQIKATINPIQHLNDYQMSLAAEAMIENDYDNLPEDISGHLSACKKCKSDLLVLVEVLDQMPVEKEAAVIPMSKKTSSKRWIWAVAATIALLIVSSLFFWQRSNTYQEKHQALIEKVKKPVTISADSALIRLTQSENDLKEKLDQYADSMSILSDQLKKNENLLATAYSPNASFEKQIKMNLRSNSIEVLSSNNIATKYGDIVTLKWDSEGSQNIGIAIYNNKGLFIIQKSNLESSFNFNSKKVTPGIYYWKLIGSEGVVYIGSIKLE